VSFGEIVLLPAAKATLLLAPALLYARFSRRASAAARHLACLAALSASLLLPLLTVALPARAVGAIPAAAVEAGGGATVLFAVWAAGFSVAAFLRIRDGVALRRLLGRGRPVADLRLLRAADAAAAETGVPRPVRLVLAPGARVPFVAGLLRPVVALPEEARRWGGSRLRAVLLHELSHVRRRDPLTQAVADVAAAVFWFHPLVRFAARRMREEREAACDDPVLARGARPSRYAAMLLGTAARLREVPASAAALGRAHPLARRLGVLLGGERRRGGPGRARIAGALGAALLVAAALAPLAPARTDARRCACGHVHEPGTARSVSVSVSVSASAVAR
jgi:beta-lactamase regulating signal transducer with metallopeptidase domain